MKQIVNAGLGYDCKKLQTGREKFLFDMGKVILRAGLARLIKKIIPKQALAAGSLAWSGCCTSISCGSGLICQIRQFLPSKGIKWIY